MRIAVIGGGIGGLTAAHALVGAGFDVHVLDAAEKPGGVIGTSRVDGFLREHAASSFLAGPSRGALRLCDELGVPVEPASANAKRRWIFIDGQLRPVPRNPVEFVRSDLLTWRGKLALLREPFAPPRVRGDDESMHAWAARRLGPEAARAFIAPLVTGVFAADSHDVSLEAGFPRFASLDEQGGLARGFAKQAAATVAGKLMAAAGNSGRARRRKRRQGMFAPTGGLGALTDALAASLGPRVHLGRRVYKLAAADKGVLVDGERWDAVVLATSATDGSALTADGMPDLAAKLRELHRAPVALVYLGVSQHDVPAAADGFGALVAAGEDPRVLGIVFESTVWPNRAPQGYALLRCIYGGSRDPEATQLSDHDLIEQAVRDVAHVLGADVAPEHASVVRWDRGLAQYPVGHRDRVRAAVAAGRTQRIALAGADYRGAGVNDICADRDVIVAELRTWA
jgi:protoporphyrinogen/coproporphyrinogen III oxidase